MIFLTRRISQLVFGMHRKQMMNELQPMAHCSWWAARHATEGWIENEMRASNLHLAFKENGDGMEV